MKFIKVLKFVCAMFWAMKAPSINAEVKMTKLECNTSQISMINVYCRLRSWSRTEQTGNFSLELIRNVKNPTVTYNLLYKSGVSWRQIIHLEKVKVCDLLSGSNMFQFLIAVRDAYNALAPPSLPRKCPIKKGKYSAANISLVREDLSYTVNRAMTVGELPNGVYRHVINLSDDEDPLGATLWWHLLVNIRMNEDRF